jgi:hypothetical protein
VQCIGSLISPFYESKLTRAFAFLARAESARGALFMYSEWTQLFGGVKKLFNGVGVTC